MSEPQPGSYQIVSVSQSGQAASVNNLPAVWQIVHLGEQTNVWDIKKIGDNLYTFSIPDRFTYSGVSDDNKVVASLTDNWASPWYLQYRDNSNAWTIALDRDHNQVWTVAGTGPLPEIQISQTKYLPPNSEPPVVEPSQLFRFTPA